MTASQSDLWDRAALWAVVAVSLLPLLPYAAHGVLG